MFIYLILYFSINYIYCYLSTLMNEWIALHKSIGDIFVIFISFSKSKLSFIYKNTYEQQPFIILYLHINDNIKFSFSAISIIY